MRNELRERLEAEERASSGRMRKPADLLSRMPSSEDFVDSAVIGGTSLADIVAGKIQEHQIPHEVQDAFHAQYPHLHEDFVHAVQRLSSDGSQLGGLVNGVKGKLFELKYVDWLNHGHLPIGYTAELATSSTNPAWDIAIHDHAGHVSELLQMKASQSISYVMDAIRQHPNIDVVIPHDLFSQVSTHPELLGHVIDGGQTLDAMNHGMSRAVLHAEAADIHFHFPIIGMAFIVGTTYLQYRGGKLNLESALNRMVERSFLSIISTAVAWGSAAAMHEPIVGLPVGILTRWLLGGWLAQKKLRKVLDHQIEIISDSTKVLGLTACRVLTVG